MVRARAEGIQMLRGAVQLVGQAKGNPTGAMLDMLRKHIVDAIALLEERDPLVQRAGLIVLAIKQSTRSTRRIVRGKTINRHEVLDQVLFEWAIAEAHSLAEIND